MIWQVKENCVEQRWKNGEWTCAYACNDSNLLLQNETTEFGDWIHIVFSCNLVAVRLWVTTCTDAQSYSSMSNIQGSDCQRRISVECGPVGKRIYKLCALPLSENTWPPCPNSWTGYVGPIHRPRHETHREFSKLTAAPGQSKKNAMIHYLLCRIMTGKHKEITLSFYVCRPYNVRTWLVLWSFELLSDSPWRQR